MRPTLKVLALAALVTGYGGIATAQQAPVAPRAGGGVTAMLNARRLLDLTPRQVAQLDSIERGLHAERQRVAAAMRPAMDSMRQRVRTQGMPRDSVQRQQLRQQAEQRRATMRPQMEQLRARDSAATAAAERLLNDTQRGKWREMQAERRGFERGMRVGRDGRGGQRGPAMQGRPGQGRPGMMRAPQGQRPPQGPPQVPPMRRPAPDAR